MVPAQVSTVRRQGIRSRRTNVDMRLVPLEDGGVGPHCLYISCSALNAQGLLYRVGAAPLPQRRARSPEESLSKRRHDYNAQERT